ncbi:MAG: hypothetical protein FWF36_03220 [Propionibacteriaceae bacterium]|nr:hypothetical protein [Propionibacteriaceae bacterium]
MAFDPEELRIQAQRRDRECRRIASSFSGCFMNDTKWRKLFHACCLNRELIVRCCLKELDAPQPTCSRDYLFPAVDRFSQSFWDTGMGEVVWPSGFVVYRHIAWIRFPRTWTVPRGKPGVPAAITGQDVDQIAVAVLVGGSFETSIDGDGLTIYGYR